MGDEARRTASVGAADAQAKGGDPWAASAAKLGAEAFPAHVRKQFEEVLATQVQAAASSFESTAKSMCDAASAKFLEPVAGIAKDLTQKNERTEREVFLVKQRMDKAEAANAELKASVAKLEAIVSEAEARVPSINATNLGTWDREPDPVTFWIGCSVPMVETDIRPVLAD
eukprot:1064366-Pyramimonas_sp.AAC.1